VGIKSDRLFLADPFLFRLLNFTTETPWQCRETRRYVILKRLNFKFQL